MDRSRFLQSERKRVATYWALNVVLVLFFYCNQMETWSRYDSGKFYNCTSCPFSSTGMEVLWMVFPLLGAYITKPCLDKEGNRLFHRYLKWSLYTMVALTIAKVTLRFCNPNDVSYWRIGLLLECNWLYISITNLIIWIYQNWNKDFAKTKHGWLTPRQHCVIFYCIPAVLMVATVIIYRTMEFAGADKTCLTVAISCCEAAFVLSPIKASISWHFRA